MAKRNLDIIVKVRDAATGALNSVSNALKGTGNAANKANLDFTKFNRTMFSATAFIGMFQKAFTNMASVVEKGAEMSRVSDQFERVLGPKGDLFNLISQFTDNSVDRFAAMQEGIALKSMGIVQNTGQIAELVAKAGTAAKLAGKQSGEGIEQFSNFLKDGSVSHLQFLNLIAQTNPALQAQMAILHKVGGVMGTVIGTQQKLAIGMGLLNAVTRGHLKGERDLLDVVLDVKQAFMFLKAEVGTFLGTALAPMVDKIKDMIFAFTASLENIRKTDKNILFLTKSIIITTGAIGALVLGLGALRLSIIALSSVGIGIPGLTFTLLGLSAVFLGITSRAEGFVEKLKVFGGLFRGVFQLVHSFLSDPENFAKGIGKMDKSLYDMLQKNGLIELAATIARVTATVAVFVKDTVAGVQYVATKIDQVFGFISRSIIGSLGVFKGEWSRFWVEDNQSFMGKAMRWVAVAGAIGASFLALRGIFGAFTGVMSKVPVIGKFFGGGGGRGPSGGAGDPLYVVPMGGGLAGALGGAGGLGLLGKAGLVGAAGVAGYGIGTGINSLADKYGHTNKYGQEYNAYEKGMAKVLPHWAGGMTSEQYSDTYGKNSGSQYTSDMPSAPSKQSSLVIPDMPEGEESKLKFLSDQMMNMDKSKQGAFAQSVSQAYESNSPGGGVITKDEWVEIFRKALDTSQNLSDMADDTGNPAPQMPNNLSRRMNY